MWYDNRWVMYVYFFLIMMMYGGIALVYLDFAFLTVQQLTYLRMMIQILIAVVLMIRFSPHRHRHRLVEGDSTLIFASGTFLVANVILESLHLSP